MVHIRLFLVIALILSTEPALFASEESNVFSELLQLSQNKKFLYEQTVVPSSLRKFFIPLSLVYENTMPLEDWCTRINRLLVGLSLPTSVHYVARKYAPSVYALIDSMCATMSIETTLIFVARRSNKHIKAVEAFSLGGGFNALVFSHVFVGRRTGCEIRAVVARELTKLARRHCEKKNLARKIWWGLAGSIAAVGAVSCLQIAMKNGDWWHHAKELISYHSTSGLISLLGVAGCGLTAEIIDMYLSRKYQREADSFALKAFGGRRQEYLEALKSIEIDEALRRQRIDHHYADYYGYVEAKISEIDDAVYPRVVTFLKNELLMHRKRQIEMPAMLQKAGIFDTWSSLDERVAYVHEHASLLCDDIMRPKSYMPSEDDVVV